MEAKELTKLAVKALEDKKGEDIRVIDIHGVSVLADYFVIADGSNASQVKAMADNVEEELGKAGHECRQIEGYIHHILAHSPNTIGKLLFSAQFFLTLHITLHSAARCGINSCKNAAFPPLPALRPYMRRHIYPSSYFSQCFRTYPLKGYRHP